MNQAGGHGGASLLMMSSKTWSAFETEPGARFADECLHRPNVPSIRSRVIKLPPASNDCDYAAWGFEFLGLCFCRPITRSAPSS